MAQNDAVDRFRRLQEQYDAENGHGATLDVKEELELGSGMFDEELTVEEIKKLNQELENRLPCSTA